MKYLMLVLTEPVSEPVEGGDDIDSGSIRTTRLVSGSLAIASRMPPRPRR